MSSPELALRPLDVGVPASNVAESAPLPPASPSTDGGLDDVLDSLYSIAIR
eukprot:CAMPEP_0202039622 /NCGR_PEP_ID=MMETSP0962-20130828/17190_1 /ASSEMBLY_ACC=CAM_ASM_000488 /TAXON_ID=4773 /ORGANISM="Schizochytrium aggregatum, Strain ATCC28209" /LENGTH=50 /DNA_ID=CAMNT_0048603853 /DNA_START=34 /DNA_END=183 /DNA_ORIENTATION=+